MPHNLIKLTTTKIQSHTRSIRYLKAFTLIEVMVSLVIVAIGLLGIAAMHLHSMQGNSGALLRTQASFIANDIATRMRVNKLAMENNIYAAADYQAACAAQVKPNCTTAQCNSNEIAQTDIADFICAIENELPNSNNTSITCTDIDITDADPCSTGSSHTVSLSWAESTTAPNADSLADVNQVSTITMVVRP
jgi:type IV pilus assembly protein PilV